MVTNARPNNTRNVSSSSIAEKLLGDLELAIMRVAWTRESVTVRDVLEVLSTQRSLAYTTVMTVMGRLAKKGLLVVEQCGKTYRYRAAQTSAEFEAQAARQVVQSLIDDFGDELAISQFVRQLSEANPAQLAQLAELARLAQEEDE
ncbi:MAG: BlaI/MecI/CopY family transcriptional regulator [Chloroflexi bacterium]|nr:BlaI/MecI/CopY family transcriptional regulator [Chloroflexota bacterium]